MSDDDTAAATLPLDEQLEDAFAPYITAAGQVVHHWNQLQERLGKLFTAVTGKGKVALAIWYAPLIDRTQPGYAAIAAVLTVSAAKTEPTNLETSTVIERSPF